MLKEQIQFNKNNGEIVLPKKEIENLLKRSNEYIQQADGVHQHRYLSR